MASNAEQSNSSVEDSPFFQKRKAKDELIVKDLPKFDLESYIANYAGATRLVRLHHIGSHSPYLAVEAYRLAITEAKKGKNATLYLNLVAELSEIAPQDPAALADTAWTDKKAQEMQREQARLEHELKSYKNNLIKESIRMGNEDLGHFFFDIGDYSNAHKSYTKMREHCTSNKHLTDMTLQLVFVSIAQKSWLTIQSNLAKVDGSQLRGEEKIKLDPIISACSGLASMSVGNFRDAATSFLATPSNFMIMEAAANVVWQKEVLTGNDVAVYGGLCALASMDRFELAEKVLGNAEFRNFLELEPHIRRAITLFCGSKYSACLEVLEGYRNDYLLDIYLSKVVNTIYNRIRTKSIVQYFIPFSCVTLDEMSAKFPHKTLPIEEELEHLINDKVLDARLDLVERLLISPPRNPRYEIQAQALEMAEEYDHQLRLRLTRLNMLAAGMEIRADKKSENNPGSEGGTSMGLRGLGSKMGFN